MSARVLVVDDDEHVRDLLVRLLQRDGFKVVAVQDGESALQVVAAQAPDLVLLDVTMPGMDGFTVCQRLKDNPQTALIPITLITGLGESAHRQHGMEVGADDFLTKPLEISLLRARVHSQLRLKRITDQLERTESVIFTLALMVEAKDAYTEGHLRRLASYSEQLALAVGLLPDEVRAVRFGGLLHDIGKIAIDDSILLKPTALTAAEYEEIKQHPNHSMRIIAPLRFANEVGPIVRGHHEQWNGGGYPQGLRGEAIPRGARIVAIVDAYDAMTTDRPYRRALTQAHAIACLREGAGQQWDPELVALFLHLIEQDVLANPTSETLMMFA